jgi:hypothetical protein
MNENYLLKRPMLSVPSFYAGKNKYYVYGKASQISAFHKTRVYIWFYKDWYYVDIRKPDTVIEAIYDCGKRVKLEYL